MRQCPCCKIAYENQETCPICAVPMHEVVDRRVGSTVAGVQVRQRVSGNKLAAVYRGTRGEACVALKVYHNLGGGGAGRARREQEALARIDHPCVAKLLDAGELDDGSLYLISEWIEGESLEQVLSRGGQPWERLIPVLHDVASGLQALHGAGVVHRDLKPSNIVLPRLGRARAVLLDFGHALLAHDQRITTSGQIVGSAQYVAPEQAAGRDVDGRADLYAMGVILYRALTGTLPFDSTSPAELLQLHQTEPVQPPTQRAPEAKIPRAAEELCLWLLAKQPQQRVPNPRVLRITLQALEQPAPREDVA